MSDLHRYGFAYGHPRVPIPPSDVDDPAKAAFLAQLRAKRLGIDLPLSVQSSCLVSASTREESPSSGRASKPAPIFTERPCRVCGGFIPAVEKGRKVRFDTETCSPACRKRKATKDCTARRSEKRRLAREAKGRA